MSLNESASICQDPLFQEGPNVRESCTQDAPAPYGDPAPISSTLSITNV